LIIELLNILNLIPSLLNIYELRYFRVKERSKYLL